MLGQFHVEGFVNPYARNRAASSPKRLIFESDHFENFNNSSKAKETSDIISEDEFIDMLELAPPDKPFQLYSRNHLKREKINQAMQPTSHLRYACGQINTFASNGWVAYLFLVRLSEAICY